MTDIALAYVTTAQRILAAVDALPVATQCRLVDKLGRSRSTTLSAIAAAVDSDDPLAYLTRALRAEVLIGDAQHDAARLRPDLAPWGEIRAALVDLIAAYRAAHPGWRTAHDRRSAG